jgi:hypothetical protein
MFRRYMIVLAVLALVSGTFTASLFYREEQARKLFYVISKECNNIEEGTEAWKSKCSLDNPYSESNLRLENLMTIEKNYSKSIAYAGYVLLVILGSAALRWIWNGRLK